MTSPKNIRIGRFSVIKPLGRGAQGAVYLAHDPDLDRRVAIKLVIDMPGQSDAAADGWPQARNLAQLRHPNIVALYELGKFHSFTYLVFEYLQGTELRKELKAGGAFALPMAYGTILQITDAMAYAHAKGILHLDLNPNNIMRDEEGKPRIMDFDLSRRADVQPQSDLIMGTLPYMAPEYFLTQRLDTRTDVYALGQILYAFLAGTLAVPITNAGEMTAHICEKDADFSLLQRMDPGGHFTQVIRQATVKDPAQRYPHARAMHDALVVAWKKSQPAVNARDAVFHGTVAFVLKRIERRGDFPAVSKTLTEINHLTSGDSQSPISRLTSVVLRDYALTNRLLKLANSSYYARAAGKVKTVSDAINLLGIDQVRLTCNGLACFGHFAGRKQDIRLKEESIASFIAGLVARHLAAQMKAKATEEAFLAGMLFNLGKMLALFYFPDDYEEIEDLVTRGATMDEAARSVLGISLAEMGCAVGEVWGLSPIVLSCMLENPSADELAQTDGMQSIVRFANTLTGVDAAQDPTGVGIAACAAQLQPLLVLSPAQTHALLQAANEKFKTFAQALEVDLAKSSCVQRLERWLTVNAEHLQSIAQQVTAKAA